MKNLNPLTAISPIDGRYHDKTVELSDFFSEYALIKYRVRIEIEYFIALTVLPLKQLQQWDPIYNDRLRQIVDHFSLKDAQKIKAIEEKINHDVKAVEYFIKEKFYELQLDNFSEFVHFGLTSQDINNTAVPLSIKDALAGVMLPAFERLTQQLEYLSKKWNNIPMLARTHGQPASPTRLGKEIAVFATRLQEQIGQLRLVPVAAKFGGATGNFNAHFIAYPKIDWHLFASQFVEQQLRLKRSFPTTQIEHYDYLAALCDAFKRLNTILIDLCRDCWTYISMNYFEQKIIPGEVGSSAMPHKVNPIDFENAEGNLGIANALFNHLSQKLPISRLQRDLTDSTVLRNTGVPMSHTLLSIKSIAKGLDKLVINEKAIQHDLDQNWMVIAEAIQTVLRREGYPKPYEALKKLTRTNRKITKNTIHRFIDKLDVPNALKNELKKISPWNFTGK